MSKPTRTPGYMVEPVDEREIREHAGGLFERLEPVYGEYFPNSLRIMGRDPQLTMALVELGQLVLQRPGRVPLDLKWMVASVSSRSAGCSYCTVHTARHGSTNGIAIEKLRDLCNFESSDQFSEAERAALQLASHAGRTPNETSIEDFEELRKHFDDDAILEIVAVISFFGFFNRWNDTLSVPLEDKPLQFGLEVLTSGGWNPGRHAGGR